MGPDAAELSSMSSTITQLARRVASMAAAATAAGSEETAAELYAIERSLSGAERRMARLVDRGR